MSYRLKKYVEELKEPSNKILITCLIIAVTTLFGLYIKSSYGTESVYKNTIKQCDYDRLKFEIQKTKLEDRIFNLEIKILQLKTSISDSIIQILIKKN